MKKTYIIIAFLLIALVLVGASCGEKENKKSKREKQEEEKEEDLSQHIEAKNNTIKSDLSIIATAAELYYANNGSYLGYSIGYELREVPVPPNCSSSNYVVQIAPNGKKFLAYAKSCKEGFFWCIDNSGELKELMISNIPVNAYVCD